MMIPLMILWVLIMSIWAIVGPLILLNVDVDRITSNPKLWAVVFICGPLFWGYLAVAGIFNKITSWLTD